MAYSLIAHTIVGGATTSSIDTTGASFLIMSASGFGVVSFTFSDSKSNIWVPLTAKVGASTCTQMAYCITPTVGTGHTFSVNNVGFPAVAVQAWSGSLASPFDVQNGNSATTAATSIATNSVTPSQDNELIVACVQNGTADEGVLSVDSSLTISDSFRNNGSAESLGMAYFVQGTAAAINPTFSWTTSSSDRVAAIATFKAAASDVLFAQACL